MAGISRKTAFNLARRCGPEGVERPAPERDEFRGDIFRACAAKTSARQTNIPEFQKYSPSFEKSPGLVLLGRLFLEGLDGERTDSPAVFPGSVFPVMDITVSRGRKGGRDAERDQAFPGRGGRGGGLELLQKRPDRP